jgi:hypothetical protein
MCWRLQACRSNRRTHGGTGRQSVIDQYHPLPSHGWRGAFAPIGQVTALQLQNFLLRDCVDGRWGDVQATDEIIVQHPHAAAGNGAHRHLLMAGRA